MSALARLSAIGGPKKEPGQRAESDAGNIVGGRAITRGPREEE